MHADVRYRPAYGLNLAMTNERCEHYDVVGRPAPTSRGCEQCLALGEDWVALRVCMSCGHVGCCEDSPRAHALAHFHATGHPIIRPFDARERWTWCYVHNRYFKELSLPSRSRSGDSIVKRAVARLNRFRGRS